VKEEGGWVKLLKKSDPLAYDTPDAGFGHRHVALIAEYNDHYYFLLRREDDGRFIGPEDLLNEYDTLLEALLAWKQFCDGVKKAQKDYYDTLWPASYRNVSHACRTQLGK
jgi:hypothetical protein